MRDRRLITFLSVALQLLCGTALPGQGTLKYFGYANGGESITDLQINESFTNFAQTDGVWKEWLVQRVQSMNVGHVLAVIDLGRVLFAQNTPTAIPCPGRSLYAWCLSPDFLSHWQTWLATNSPVLGADQVDQYVLAFQVVTEPIYQGISWDETQTAVSLVKRQFPLIPTYIIEGAAQAAHFYNVEGLDWVGLDRYFIRPLSDQTFAGEMATLRRLMRPGQKIIYVMDAWYTGQHSLSGIDYEEMGSIAREWFELAASDPQAIALGAFSWPSFPTQLGQSATIGSRDFMESIRDVHISIGATIRGNAEQGHTCAQRLASANGAERPLCVGTWQETSPAGGRRDKPALPLFR